MSINTAHLNAQRIARLQSASAKQSANQSNVQIMHTILMLKITLIYKNEIQARYTGSKEVSVVYNNVFHDDVIKWEPFPRYWPFVRGIHRSPVKSPHKGQWRGVLRFSLMCTWANGWSTNRDAGDLRRHCAHYDDTVMCVLKNAVNAAFCVP